MTTTKIKEAYETSAEVKSAFSQKVYEQLIQNVDSVEGVTFAYCVPAIGESRDFEDAMEDELKRYKYYGLTGDIYIDANLRFVDMYNIKIIYIVISENEASKHDEVLNKILSDTSRFSYDNYRAILATIKHSDHQFKVGDKVRLIPEYHSLLMFDTFKKDVPRTMYYGEVMTSHVDEGLCFVGFNVPEYYENHPECRDDLHYMLPIYNDFIIPAKNN